MLRQEQTDSEARTIQIDLTVCIEGVKAKLLQRLVASVLTQSSRVIFQRDKAYPVQIDESHYYVALNCALLVMDSGLYLLAPTSDSLAVVDSLCERLRLISRRFQHFFDVLHVHSQLQFSTADSAFFVIPRQVDYHYVVVSDVIDLGNMTLEQNVFLAAYLNYHSQLSIAQYGSTAGFIIRAGGHLTEILSNTNQSTGFLLDVCLRDTLVARHTQRQHPVRRYEIISHGHSHPVTHCVEDDPLAGFFRVLGRLIPYGQDELLLYKAVKDAAVKIWCPTHPNHLLAELENNIRQDQSVGLTHVLQGVNNAVRYGDAIARRLVHLQSKPTAMIYEAALNRIYLAQTMRFLSGESISDVIWHERVARDNNGISALKPLSASKLLERARRYALAVLEQSVLAGVIHGDIKPDNLLDGGNEFNVFLIDPDSAQFVDDLTVDRYTGPTRGYAGPEYYWPHLRPGINSDVYSLYVVLKLLFGAQDPVSGLSVTFRSEKMFAGLFTGITDFSYGEACRMQALFHVMARANPNERCSVEVVVNYIDDMILLRLQKGFPHLQSALKNTLASAKVIRDRLWQLARLQSAVPPPWEMGYIYLNKLEQMRALFADDASFSQLDADPLLLRYFVFILHIAVFSNVTCVSDLRDIALELIDKCADAIKDFDLLYQRVDEYRERLDALGEQPDDIQLGSAYTQLSLFEGKVDAIFALCGEYTLTIDHLNLLVGDRYKGAKLIKAYQERLDELDAIAMTVRILEARYLDYPVPVWLSKATIRETYTAEFGDRPRGRSGYIGSVCDRSDNQMKAEGSPVSVKYASDSNGLARTSLFASSSPSQSPPSRSSSSSSCESFDSSDGYRSRSASHEPAGSRSPGPR